MTLPISPTMKLVKGFPGKRPVRAGLKPAAPTSIRPPEHLSPAAKVVWRQVGPEAMRTGLVTLLDLPLLALFCTAIADEKAHGRALAKLEAPFTVLANGYAAQHPLVNLRRGAAQDASKYAALLGLAPTRRTGLDVKVAPPERLGSDGKPLSRFFPDG